MECSSLVLACEARDVRRPVRWLNFCRAPPETRTPGRLLRRQPLLSTELVALTVSIGGAPGIRTLNPRIKLQKPFRRCGG